MTRSDQITMARKVVGENLGFENFDGTIQAFKELSQKKQIQLNEGVAAYIAANPTEFPADAVELSEKIVKGQAFGTPLAEVTFGEAVAEFKEEFVNQGADLAQKAGSGIAYSLGIAVVAGAILGAAPSIVKFIGKTLKKG